MSLTITTDVFCDFCPAWVDGVTGKRVGGREARKGAAAWNWVHKRDQNTGCMVDVCPACQGMEWDGVAWQGPAGKEPWALYAAAPNKDTEEQP